MIMMGKSIRQIWVKIRQHRQRLASGYKYLIMYLNQSGVGTDKSLVFEALGPEFKFASKWG